MTTELAACGWGDHAHEWTWAALLHRLSRTPDRSFGTHRRSRSSSPRARGDVRRFQVGDEVDRVHLAARVREVAVHPLRDLDEVAVLEGKADHDDVRFEARVASLDRARRAREIARHAHTSQTFAYPGPFPSW